MERTRTGAEILDSMLDQLETRHRELDERLYGEGDDVDAAISERVAIMGSLGVIDWARDAVERRADAHTADHPEYVPGCPHCAEIYLVS